MAEIDEKECTESIHDHYMRTCSSSDKAMDQMRTAWGVYRDAFRREFSGRKEYRDVLGESRKGHPYCDPLYFATLPWTVAYDYRINDIVEDRGGKHRFGYVTGFSVADADRGNVFGMVVNWMDGGVDSVYFDPALLRGFARYDMPREVVDIVRRISDGSAKNTAALPPYDPKDRAEVIRSMDCLMHHLNDEDAIAPWLSAGVPDGLDWHRTDDYMEFSDDEMEAFVKLFCRIIDNQAFVRKYVSGLFCCNFLHETKA